MPVAAQLMALNELGREELELFVTHIGEVHESSRPKLDRMKELDSFLEDKRVRCHQVRKKMFNEIFAVVIRWWKSAAVVNSKYP